MMTPRAVTEADYRWRSGDAAPRGRPRCVVPDQPPAPADRALRPGRPPRCRRRRGHFADAIVRPGFLTVFIIDIARREDSNAEMMVTGRPTIREDFPMTARRDGAEARGTNADQM
jgi:hypothetical protein